MEQMLSDAVLDLCWVKLKKINGEDPSEPYIHQKDLMRLNQLLEEALQKTLLDEEQINTINDAISESADEVTIEKNDLKEFYRIICNKPFHELLAAEVQDYQDQLQQQEHQKQRPRKDEGEINNDDDDLSEILKSEKNNDSKINSNAVLSKTIYSINSDEEEDLRRNDDSPLAFKKPKSRVSSLNRIATSTPLFSSKMFDMESTNTNVTDEENKINSSQNNINNNNTDKVTLLLPKSKQRSISGASAGLRDASNISSPVSDELNRSLALELNKLQTIVDTKEQEIEYRDKLIEELETQLQSWKKSQQENEKLIKELKIDKELAQEYISSIELKNHKIEILSNSLKDQELENKRLTEVNKNLNTEVNELFEKLVNIESLQEKIRNNENSNDSNDNKHRLENDKLQQQVENLKSELTKLNNEKLLEINSLKLKNITIKEELSKIQDQLVHSKNNLHDKVVISKKQYRELKEAKFKQLRYLQKLMNQKTRFGSTAAAIAAELGLDSSSFDFAQVWRSIPFKNSNKSVIRMGIIIAVITALLFMIQVLYTFYKTGMLSSLSSSLSSPQLPSALFYNSQNSNMRQQLSFFNIMKLRIYDFLFNQNYAVSRFDYNVEELMLRRGAFDPEFQAFLTG